MISDEVSASISSAGNERPASYVAVNPERLLIASISSRRFTNSDGVNAMLPAMSSVPVYALSAVFTEIDEIELYVFAVSCAVPSPALNVSVSVAAAPSSSSPVITTLTAFTWSVSLSPMFSVDDELMSATSTLSAPALTAAVS